LPNPPFLLGGDLPINRIGFGAMRLAANGFTGPARDAATGIAVLRRALELGVDHIDTASFYASDDGSLTANQLIREALHPYRRGLVIATKVGPVRLPDGGVRMTTDPAELRSQVEAGLTELGLERFDMVYLRVGGGVAPLASESIGARFEALAQMRSEGLIRHLALSNVTHEHLLEASTIAPVVAVQNSASDNVRDETGLLEACEASRTAFVPFFPLGGGTTDDDQGRIESVARRYDATVPQIALARLLASSPVALAIPGTGSIRHLEENIAAGDITLTPDDLAELN
jgi:pyridoxine 4-dehydrogenase